MKRNNTKQIGVMYLSLFKTSPYRIQRKNAPPPPTLIGVDLQSDKPAVGAFFVRVQLLLTYLRMTIRRVAVKFAVFSE